MDDITIKLYLSKALKKAHQSILEGTKMDNSMCLRAQPIFTDTNHAQKNAIKPHGMVTINSYLRVEFICLFIV